MAFPKLHDGHTCWLRLVNTRGEPVSFSVEAQRASDWFTFDGRNEQNRGYADCHECHRYQVIAEAAAAPQGAAGEGVGDG